MSVEELKGFEDFRGYVSSLKTLDKISINLIDFV